MLRIGDLKRACYCGFLCLEMLVALPSQAIYSQEFIHNRWEVGKIFVREDEYGKQIPSDYWPIEIRELDKRLDVVRKQRLQHLLNPAFLENATYVAFLHRDWLASDKSRWQFRCQEDYRSISIERVSCALMDARNLPENGVQLFSNNTRFTNTGSIELVPASSNDTRWFGFQCLPKVVGGIRTFHLQVPPALLGRMLIATDVSQSISSPEVVIEPIENPEMYLPEGWGEVSLPTVTSPGRSVSSTSSVKGGPLRWWLVNLSGVSQFSLRSMTSEMAAESTILHVLSKADLRYIFGESTVEVGATFEPVGSSRQPIQFRLHPSLRIIDVTADSGSLQWKTIHSPSDSQLIQLEFNSIDSPTRIELRAMAKLTLREATKQVEVADNIPLPSITMENSFALQGTTKILGGGNCRVVSIESDAEFMLSAGSFSSQVSSTEEDGSDSSLALEWQCQWVGQPKPGLVHLAYQSERWDSEGLTKLILNEASVSAIANVRFTGKYLSTNKVVLPVADYWIIDSAQMLDDQEGAFQLQLIDLPNDEQQIEIQWQHPAESVSFDLRLLARHPNLNPGNLLTVEDARIVPSLQGNGSMNYQVRVNDGYQFRYSPQLLQMSISKQDIPLWQQSLIENSDTVLLRDYSSGNRLFQVVRNPEQESLNAVTQPKVAAEIPMPQIEESSDKAWIWSETVVHRWSDPGIVLHEIQVDVQSQNQPKLSIEFPNHWQLQSVAVGEQALSEYSGSRPGRLEIPLEVGERTLLAIRLRSQEKPLAWHGELKLYKPHYDMPVLESKQSLLTSPKCIVISSQWNGLSSMSALASGSTDSERLAARWQPINWWRLMNWENSDSNSVSGWNRIDLKPPLKSKNEPELVRVVDRHTLIAVTWSVVAMLSILSWLLLRKSLTVWLLVLSLSICVNWVAADGWLMISQLVLMSLVCGSICRVVERILSRSQDSAYESSFSKSGVGLTSLMVAMTFCSTAHAQPTTEPNFPLKDDVTTYGVFIPSDSDHQPVGEYAYIPKQLRDLLYSDPSGGSGQRSGSILSASYALRLRHNERDQDTAPSCLVELRVLVNQANSEILIPIRGPGLEWIGTPLLNGQARVWGGRNFNQPVDGSGVSFRAEATGVMDLKLEFKPQLIDEGDRRFRIVVDIPPIATAKFRVSSVSAIANLSINSQGLVQRTFLGDTIANLGPVDKLEVGWNISQRLGNVAPAEQISETWLHSQADRIFAACQITIQRGQNLPHEMDLIVNGDWQPAGDSWRDVNLVGLVSSGNQSRNVFRVRKKELSGDDCKIQLMLIPREDVATSNLTAPFLMLDRVNTKATYLWWSTDGDAGWFPEIAESRPVREGLQSDWGDFSLASQRVGYQIFGTGVAIRRQPTTPPNVPISEVNSINFRRHQTVLSYVANWEPTGNQPQSLLLRIPFSLVAPELEINGVPAKYQMDSDKRLMFISMKDNGIGRLGRLKVQLELPGFPQKLHSVPRIGVWKTTAASSVYELYQGLGVRLQLTGSDGIFTLMPTDINELNAESLQEMDMKFGELDLSQSPTHDGSLPLELEVLPTVEVPAQSQVVYLEPSAVGWKATVRCTWKNSPETPKFAFFDLPFSARDGLTAGKAAFKFMPHIAPDRTNLCVPIIRDEGSSPWVEFSFPLGVPANARTISLPLVLPHGSENPLVIGLPKAIENEKVRWHSVGPALGATGNQKNSMTFKDGYEPYAISSATTTITWQPILEESRKADLLYTTISFSSSSMDQATGKVSYWLDVRDNTSIRFTIPNACKVLGVLSDGHDARWSIAGSELAISLPPSSLPVQLHLITQWSETDSGRLSIPLLENQSSDSSVAVALQSNLPWRPVGQVTTVERFEEHLANIWGKAIVLAAQYLPNISDSEASAWMAQWQPESAGVSSQWSITDPVLLANSLSLDLDNNGAVTTGELWKGLEMIVESSAEWTVPTRRIWGNQEKTLLWQVSGSDLLLELGKPLDVKLSNQPRLLALALAFLPFLVISTWLIQKWARGLLMHSWVEWWVLSILLWVLLPIYWLGALAALVGCWQAAQHWMQRRRLLQRS